MLVYHIFENTRLKLSTNLSHSLSALGQFFMGYFWEKLPSHFPPELPSSHYCTGGGVSRFSTVRQYFQRWTTSELICIQPSASLKNKFVQIQTSFSMTKYTWGPYLHYEIKNYKNIKMHINIDFLIK